MQLNDIVHRNEKQFMISHLGNEMVLMDIQQGHYINVNEVGSVIWNKLAVPLVVRDLIHSLVAEYGVSTAQCEDETLKFLRKLQQHHMLNIQ